MATQSFSDKKFQEFLQRNQEFLASGSFQAPRPLAGLEAAIRDMDWKGVYILTCADSRIFPEEIFGLKKGDASVIRNAGGRAIESDVFRTLAVMSSIAPIGTLVVLHHTDCGGLFTTDEKVATAMAKRAPEHAHKVQGYTFGTFADIGLDESIRVDVEKIKSWEFLEKDTIVLGFAYEVETGRLRQSAHHIKHSSPPVIFKIGIPELGWGV